MQVNIHEITSIEELESRCYQEIKKRELADNNIQVIEARINELKYFASLAPEPAQEESQ